MAEQVSRRVMKRKLTTIFCADVSGYSRMMGFDEARTLATLKEYREAIEGFIARHHGRVVSWSGDGLLAEFASVVEAVQCGAEVQRELRARNAGRDEDQRMTFRIGINLGDVMVDGDDIFGEGVNIAARLQQMAVPGGILISAPVYDQVRGKLSMGFSALGAQQVKNISSEVAVYSVTLDGVEPHVAPRDAFRTDEGQRPVSAEVPQRKRGKLVRRGLALAIDYFIVALACMVGALALNSLVSPTIVRMDLDIPFFELDGDIVRASEWSRVSSEVDDNQVQTVDERIVTYSYFGLFEQAYRQQRTVGLGAENRRQSGEPQVPVPPVPPVPGVGEPPAPPAPPIPPAPPAPPGVPEVDVPGVSIGRDGSVNVGDGRIVIDERGVRIGRPDSSACGEDGDRFFSVTVDHDDEQGWRVKYCHVDEQLVDPATENAITRPSLDSLSLLILALYFAIMEAGRSGSTIGKRAFDLNVTREDGRPLSFATALGRNAIKVLTVFILPITILVALFSRRRQAIHDRLVGTVVVREVQ